MAFAETPTHKQFRAAIRQWLEENLPEEPFSPVYTDKGFEQLREWDRALNGAGYAAVGWPQEYGGLGADRWTQMIFEEEYERANAPIRLSRMGLSLAGPTIMVHGTPEQKAKWIPAILNCDDIWCQGFSEPAAGSDLAGLRTRGEIVGDDILVNGMKIWTSMGPVATRMFALVRTDSAAPKHRGITFLVLDMDSPGVEVSPLVQLHGERGFAEVTFTDVRVPLSNVVGEVNNGWQVAMTTLGVERGTGGGRHAALQHSLEQLNELISTRPDPVLRSRLGLLRAWVYAYEQATYDIVEGLVDGRDMTTESSVMKLCWSEIDAALHEATMSCLGGDAEVLQASGPYGEFLGWRRDYWHSRASKIYAGTNQIQKNIIAERVLGLPKEKTESVR